MLWNNTINGKYIKLTSVTPTTETAEFIVKLRRDEKRGKFIHETSDDIEVQKQWIRNQNDHDNDYYFLMINSNNEFIGTVSIYNIADGKAELGRWVSIGNAIENMDSVYSLHKWAFLELKLDLVYTKTLSENKKVVNFWKKFGAEMQQKEETEVGLISPGIVKQKKFFEEIEPRIFKILHY